MNYIDSIITIEEQLPVVKKAPGKRFVRSLEYEVIANLAKKQFLVGDVVLFDRLLSIPLTERIPGLINEYGLKRAHRLIKLVLQEFCYGIGLPKSAKLSETKIAVCTCDLILAAYEDQLSLEDLIVFFERAKAGHYGKFKGMLTHFNIIQKLEQFRLERSSFRTVFTNSSIAANASATLNTSPSSNTWLTDSSARSAICFLVNPSCIEGNTLGCSKCLSERRTVCNGQ